MNWKILCKVRVHRRTMIRVIDKIAMDSAFSGRVTQSHWVKRCQRCGDEVPSDGPPYARMGNGFSWAGR